MEVMKIILAETTMMTVWTVRATIKKCEHEEMSMPEEQHSCVSYDEDNVEIEDDDKHDDETGPDSEDNDDEIICTDEAERSRYK